MAMRVRCVRARAAFAAGLVAALMLALASCEELATYAPPPPPPRGPVAQPQPQPPVVVQPQPQPPIVVQPPVVEPPVVPPQPEPVGQQVWVDTVDFDPDRVFARQVEGRWFVMTDDVTLLGFEGDEAGARRAVEVIRFYRMTSQCSIGRPRPLLQYYLCNGQPPAGPMPGESAVPIDPNRLDVVQVDDRWLLMQGNVWLLDFGPAEAEARAALAVIRQAGFTHLCFVGRPVTVMTYFRVGGAGVLVPYVAAQVVADPPCYSGPLPATIGFRATITVGQPCDVQYTWVRNDGVAGPAYAIRFPQAGFAHVTTDVSVASEGAGWVALRILAPAAVESNRALFEVRPATMPLVQAAVIAQPAVYIGRLPATIRFRGLIAVGQPCDVQCAFVRSNGTMSPVQTLRFARRGRVEVVDDWTLFRDGVGWAALQILSPVELMSNQAPFEVRSGGHRRIEVSLAADPTLYSGPLPAPILFRGLIAVSHPCEVQYVVVRSDGAQGPAERLRFDRPGAREVLHRWAVPAEGTGWAAIRIVHPTPIESERATFEVRPPAHHGIRAALLAEPEVHPGPLPATVRLRGTIWAGRPCEVSYCFVRSNGETSPIQTIRFFRPGAREVLDTWTHHREFAGWEAIRIVAPVQVESNRADFAVKPRVPVVTVEVALSAEPPRYVGPAPGTVLLKALFRASRPCDVSYVFARSDSGPTQPRLLRFDGPGTREVTFPLRFTQDFTGWAAVRVLAPVAVESAQVPIRVDIRAPLHVQATLVAEPAAHPGPLPATIRFRGVITANQPCDVRYVFLSHDNVKDMPRLLRFDAPGSKEVTTNRTLNQSGGGWLVLRILEPVAADSNQAAFQVKAAPPVGVQATLEAVPPAYKGLAPGNVTFRGTIRATGPCDVSYAFVRSDGTQSAPQAVRFPRAGVQTVEETRQFAGDARGWELLRILAPAAGESAKAEFLVNIHKKARVEANLRAVPPHYNGPAPATVRFMGTVKVDQPCDVRYVFARSDGSAGAPQTLRFDAPGSQAVEDVMRFNADAKGWVMLRILAPIATEFEKAEFAVNIREPDKPKVKVSVELEVAPPKYQGPASATIMHIGTIRVDQPCEVRYTFVRSDGVPVPPRTLRFERPGAQEVEFELKLAREGSGWVQLRVLAPVAAECARADFNVKFQKPKVKVNVELAAEPPKYEGPAPGTIMLKGTIRVDQPCIVQYSLVRDGGATPPATLRFDTAGERELTFPLRFAADAKGWAQLRVLAPEREESQRVPYVVEIQEPVKEKEKPKAKEKEIERPKEKEKAKEKEPPPAAVSVEATLDADPDKHVGKLPVVVKFKGTIRVSAACQVTYVFVRSDGTTSPEHTLRFNKADDKQVNDNWKVDKDLAGWAMIRILGPVKAESNKAMFDVRRGGK